MTIGYLSDSAAWPATTVRSMANARNLVFIDSPRQMLFGESTRHDVGSWKPEILSPRSPGSPRSERIYESLVLPWRSWRSWRETFRSGFRLCNRRRLLDLPAQMDFLAVDCDLQWRFDAELD